MAWLHPMSFALCVLILYPRHFVRFVLICNAWGKCFMFCTQWLVTWHWEKKWSRNGSTLEPLWKTVPHVELSYVDGGGWLHFFSHWMYGQCLSRISYQKIRNQRDWIKLYHSGFKTLIINQYAGVNYWQWYGKWWEIDIQEDSKENPG